MSTLASGRMKGRLGQNRNARFESYLLERGLNNNINCIFFIFLLGKVKEMFVLISMAHIEWILLELDYCWLPI